jgi:choline kinase
MNIPKVGVLLVAGIGSRLRPLTDDRPKALVSVEGETILHRAVRLLLTAGVERLVVATGYREDAVRAALAHLSVPVAYAPNPQFDSTQNSVSLFHCREAIGDDDFVKLDGDVLFRQEVLTRLFASPGDLAVAVDQRDTLGEEEMKVLVEGHRITAFSKKLDPKRSAGESMGIEVVRGTFAPRLWTSISRAISEGRTNLYYEDHYDSLLPTGYDARLVDVTDLPWTEVDTREDLERACALVRAGKLG